jgi:hypothetical protein
MPMPSAYRTNSSPDLQAACRRLENLARLLDSAVAIPGTNIRFGADALLNLVPGVGTLAAKLLAAWIILEARRLGVPSSTLVRMAGNVGVDLVISSIPLAGWVGDVFFRANQRNMRLLRAHLEGLDDPAGPIIEGTVVRGAAA